MVLTQVAMRDVRTEISLRHNRLHGTHLDDCEAVALLIHIERLSAASDRRDEQEHDSLFVLEHLEGFRSRSTRVSYKGPLGPKICKGESLAGLALREGLNKSRSGDHDSDSA